MVDRSLHNIIIDKKINENYERLTKNIVNEFITFFKHIMPAKISPKNHSTSWLVRKTNLGTLRNILIAAIENSIEKEDLILLSEGSQEKLNELKLIVDGAEEDLKYIGEAVDKKVNEELKYG